MTPNILVVLQHGPGPKPSATRKAASQPIFFSCQIVRKKSFIVLISRPARSGIFARARVYFGLVSSVVIAVRIAMDPACGITEAEFPAAFIIAVVGAELRPVKSGK